MEELRKKYIDLLLNQCIYPKNKSLFISYEKEHIGFITLLIERAKQLGFENILMEERDITLEHKLLTELSVQEIVSHPYFYNTIWDQAVEGNYAFLIESTKVPHYLDDIEGSKKIAANEATMRTYRKYMESVMNDSISWTLFALPNRFWAKTLFPKERDSYQKLEELIYSFCMVDTSNPIDAWNQYIRLENKKTAYLNQLNIQELIFKNSLGTNVTISLPKNYIFRSLENNHCIENIPTYSVWTLPHKYIVDGTIYGSTPITYQNFSIEEYWFQFLNGKVVNYDAKVGREYLDHFFSRGDSHMRLGEIAIVDYNSPISKTGMIYHNNLLDENVGTHLAFGSAYQNTIQGGIKMSEEELNKAGCNVCSDHMDFTIGTSDLKIIAKTYDHREFEIFKQGNFNYELINENSPFD